MVHETRVKVLFIAGSGRSGSTLLGQILGGLDGAFFAGELRDLWREGLIHNSLCGCGRVFDQCDLWRSVLKETAQKGQAPQTEPPAALTEGLTRKIDLALMLNPWGRRRLAARFRPVLAYLSNLYLGIRSATDSRFIIDSSKFPSYGLALNLIPSIELYIVHLVRDPRGVAYSFRRHKPLPDPTKTMSIPRFGPFQSSIRWNMRNLAAAELSAMGSRRSLLIRYEDFLQKPQFWVNAILGLLKVDVTSEQIFQSTYQVFLQENHSVWGNPRRFEIGQTLIRIDDEWRRAMSRRDQKIVELMTWYKRRHYGYRVK